MKLLIYRWLLLTVLICETIAASKIIPEHINDIALTNDGKYIAWSGNNVVYFGKTKLLPSVDTLYEFNNVFADKSLQWSGDGKILYAIIEGKLIYRFKLINDKLELLDSIRIKNVADSYIATNISGNILIAAIEYEASKHCNPGGRSLIKLICSKSGFSSYSLITPKMPCTYICNTYIDQLNNIYFSMEGFNDSKTTHYIMRKDRVDTLTISCRSYRSCKYRVESISKQGKYFILSGRINSFKDRSGDNLITLFLSQKEGNILSEPFPFLVPHDDPICWNATFTPDNKKVIWTHLVRDVDGNRIKRREIRGIEFDNIENKNQEIICPVSNEQIWQFAVSDSSFALVTTTNTFIHYPSLKPGAKAVIFKTKPLIQYQENEEKELE